MIAARVGSAGFGNAFGGPQAAFALDGRKTLYRCEVSRLRCAEKVGTVTPLTLTLKTAMRRNLGGPDIHIFDPMYGHERLHFNLALADSHLPFV